MGFMSGFGTSLLQTARLYLSIVLLAPVLVFLGVEGWRAIVWLLDSIAANAPANGEAGIHPVVATVYAVLTAGYVMMAMASLGRSPGHKVTAPLRALRSIIEVLVCTPSIYGLLAVVADLIPGFPRYDLLNTTALSVAVLLGAYMLFHQLHRRANH